MVVGQKSFFHVKCEVVWKVIVFNKVWTKVPIYVQNLDQLGKCKIHPHWPNKSESSQEVMFLRRLLDVWPVGTLPTNTLKVSFIKIFIMSWDES